MLRCLTASKAVNGCQILVSWVKMVHWSLFWTWIDSTVWHTSFSLTVFRHELFFKISFLSIMLNFYDHQNFYIFGHVSYSNLKSALWKEGFSFICYLGTISLCLHCLWLLIYVYLVQKHAINPLIMILVICQDNWGQSGFKVC